MDWLQAAILALIQGLTEFLPISSSAHLILAPYLFGWKDQGLAFDVATHLGTLIAVLGYFRREVVDMLKAWVASLRSGIQSEASRLGWGIIIGTLPAAALGLFLGEFPNIDIRSLYVIACANLVFALLLGWADLAARGQRGEGTLGWHEFLYIGLAQALALIPGTSRSGITMTMALALGLSRTAAARFSFYLSIPVILLAGAYETVKLVGSPEPDPWFAIAVGVLVSCASAWLCIHWFLKLLEKIGFMPFVIYRLLLGAAILFMI